MSTILIWESNAWLKKRKEEKRRARVKLSWYGSKSEKAIVYIKKEEYPSASPTMHGLKRSKSYPL